MDFLDEYGYKDDHENDYNNDYGDNYNDESENSIFEKNEILSLIQKIKSDDNYSKNIKDVFMLERYLYQLNDLIGNEKIKKSIVSQTKYLIDEMNYGKKNTSMINTVLYGDPGTGKTTIGKIMAGIWVSLGYLEQNIDFNTLLDDFIKRDDFKIYLLALVALIEACIPFLKMLFNMISKLNFFYIACISIIVVFIVYYYYNAYKKSISEIVEAALIDKEIVKVVSREDFVDMYIGGTDKKTLNLLKRNTGKVLFIDEAYSLITNMVNDPYGMEALTTLNRYMSENPGKIGIIMAGYKKLMIDTIFKVQPGLPRRFMWYFDCDGYNSNELFNIMNLKLNKEGWRLSKKDKDKIENIFNKCHTLFKNHGGDVEKLIHYAKMDYTDNFGKKRFLNFKNISNAIEYLKTNSI